MNDNQHDVYRLEAIQGEISDLLYECKRILRSNPEYSMIRKQAEAYWIGHIEAAISEATGSAFTLQSAINDIRELNEGELNDD